MATLLTHRDRPANQDDTPRDGYGPGYLVYSLAADFHALACLIGAEAARQELAEIINAEFAGLYRRSAREN